MLKKFTNLTEWLKTYSFKKKHKIALTNKYLSTYVQIVIFLFCIDLSISIPIFQKTNSINNLVSSPAAKNTIETELISPTSTKSSAISKFIKNLIFSFDQDSDQQLNFQELSQMLTNGTLMKKFEKILLKKQGTILQKIVSSTTINTEQTTKNSSLKYLSDLKQKENTNLKSNKKSKLLEEFQKEEEEYFNDIGDESTAKMETKIFTYSPSKIIDKQVS
ncbi:hypothetical protein BpHYR1_009019 [Brachionus plicatilis]|uniref:EF-hand domain-containing protein n=1 Tax=Brachionus plicatilis TaxID=10195 RepID=A0A3M7QEE3_BRAPC|nr:hypothetical protein BpHYR1_009019 [Brachionus plicatilis]